MSIKLQTATVASLDVVAEPLASWQQDGGPVQLHPGDLGWNWSLGAEALAGAVRVWRRDRQILAVGLVEDAGRADLVGHIRLHNIEACRTSLPLS